MAKIKLTKNELKAQNDALKRYSRFLPMLQLKKQQLQAEIAGIAARAEDVARAERERRKALDSWIGLFATAPETLEGLVKIEGVKTSTANIAGVTVPVYESIEAKVAQADLFSTPPWIDEAAEAVVSVSALRAEREMLDRQRELVERELAATSQRVNLFEKVKIPECRENIRIIKISIGDEQTAAVTRGKMAKARGRGGEGAA